jgi:hypothetical protein
MRWRVALHFTGFAWGSWNAWPPDCSCGGHPNVHKSRSGQCTRAGVDSAQEQEWTVHKSRRLASLFICGHSIELQKQTNQGQYIWKESNYAPLNDIERVCEHCEEGHTNQQMSGPVGAEHVVCGEGRTRCALRTASRSYSGASAVSSTHKMGRVVGETSLSNIEYRASNSEASCSRLFTTTVAPEMGSTPSCRSCRVRSHATPSVCAAIDGSASQKCGREKYIGGPFSGSPSDPSRTTRPESSGVPGPVAAHRVTLKSPFFDDSYISLGLNAESSNWYLRMLTPCRPSCSSPNAQFRSKYFA